MYADITIKAHCHDPAAVQTILLEQQAAYKGMDVQTDTFYQVADGMLKLREGNLEHVLIHYKREHMHEVKRTEVLLYLKNPSPETVQLLYGEVQVLGQVKKRRKIFFIDNVKFHLDQVDGLGTFVEIEAIDLNGSIGVERLLEQCSFYRELLQLEEEDLVDDSYFNMKSHI
ncbi:class IV adenylate cyclase [Pontibacter mangrovi]|uniref:Class IV adenylate cyclase n=2 Tax=Pontibacter mangrovi TaxID=2589816 RepID=A0A501WEB8_9BACT|nr:class IV adenylate cyclase [Pontibacter mangrovi]